MDNAQTKLQAADIEMVAAYDERKRLFDRLRDLRLNDEDRAQVRSDYAAAAKRFDELRAKLVK